MKNEIKTSLENIYRFFIARLQLGYVPCQAIPNNENLAKLNMATKSTIEKGHSDSILNGGINPGDQKYLASLIGNLRPRSVLEIGTHVGYSTKIISDSLVKAKVENAKITTVDIIDVNSDRGPWFELGEELRPRERITCGEKIKLEFIQSDSVEFLSKTTQEFDFVFLDGSHEGGKIYQELKSLKKCLNQSATILIHDYFPNRRPLWSNSKIIYGPVMACEKLLVEEELLSVVPVGELPVETKLFSKKSSLALVELK